MRNMYHIFFFNLIAEVGLRFNLVGKFCSAVAELLCALTHAISLEILTRGGGILLP